MSRNVRSHGRLFVFSDPGYPKDTVLCDPYSKTVFLFNVSYYGWIKSLALSCSGDILEDAHGIACRISCPWNHRRNGFPFFKKTRADSPERPRPSLHRLNRRIYWAGDGYGTPEI